MPREFNLKRVLEPVKAIVRKLNDRRSVLMEEIGEIDKHLTAMGGKIGRRAKPAASGSEANGASNGVRQGKRRRRSREDLVKMADEVVELIKTKGKEGATAKEIKEKFGNLLPSVNAWLKEYSATKVKTTGEKSRMRYYA